MDTLLHSLTYSDTKVSTHTVGQQPVAQGEGAQGITGNWVVMAGWTRGCKCKDLPVWTPERRQCVHGRGFGQGSDAVPALWCQAEPSQLSTEEKSTEICSFFIFPPCLIFSWERTPWLFHSLFVQFVLLRCVLLASRDCSAQTHTPSPEGDVDLLIWLICWFWKNFNSFD